MPPPPENDPSPTRTAPLGATVTVPGAARTGAGSEAAGDFIGRYRLLEELGEGGFGVVWRAEQMEPIHREVALKVIKAGMDSREIIARFEAERQALALMDHPNIAGVLDAGTTENGRPFFAMELVKGSPITAYCDARTLSIRERLELFIPVCQAVQHAHQKSILHRDLKPSNILVMEVDGKPVPKVIDFGIAKALGQAGESALEVTLLRTQAGMVVGTPQYMSPEQAWANGDMDTRSDVYTLGVILYELLTGGTPLPREMVHKAVFHEVLRLIRESDPVRPSSRVVPVTEVVRQTATSRATVPARLTRSLRGDLDWICLRALEKERERRYGSAADLAQDLQRHLRNEPVEAGPPSALYRLQKLIRRNRLAFAAAAAMILLLLTGIAVSTWQAVRAMRAERKADEERDIAKAVNEFLQNDLLAQASSWSQMREKTDIPNPNLTVREALHRAGVGMEKRFHDKPLVEAALHFAIGGALFELGDRTEAEPHLLRAMKIRTELLGPEHPDTLEVRRERIGQITDHAEALEALLAMIALDTKVLGPADRRTISDRIGLTTHLIWLGRAAEAEVEARSALVLATTALEPDDPVLVSLRSNLAYSLSRQSKPEEAEKILRENAEITQRTMGAEHPATIGSRRSLVFFLSETHRTPEILGEMRSLLETNQRIFGENSGSTRDFRKKLGELYYEQKQYAAAEKEFLIVVPGNRMALGEAHPATVSVRRSLAWTWTRQGKCKEAEQEFRELLEIQTRVFGDDHPDVRANRISFAYALRECSDSSGAEQEWREMVAIQERGMGKEHPDTLSFRNLWAEFLRFCGNFPEAEMEHREVLAIRERVLGPEHLDTTRSRHLMGESIRSQKRFAEAENELRKVLGIYRRELGEDHVDTQFCRRQLSEALQEQGKFAELEEQRRAIMGSRQRLLGKDHKDTLGSAHHLAQCLEKQGKTDEALAFAKMALAGYEKDGAEKPETKRARELVERLEGTKVGAGSSNP